MADRIADNADLIVDEMKRKARRRLVGAIVLALAAAIILPMLLEKEPRSLGDDVSVQIPPVDDGRFINRLTGKAGEPKPAPKVDDKADSKNAAAKSEPRPEAAAGAASPAPIAFPAAPTLPIAVPGDSSAPKKSVAVAERQALSSTPKPAATTGGSPTPAPEAKGEPRSAVAEPRPATAESKTATAESKPATAESKPATAESKPATAESKPATAESKPAAAESKPATGIAPAAPPAAAAATPAKSEGFVVQLAAFADDKGANALANKLKKVGYLAYVEPVSTSRGTLWRVRVGGYGSRPEADAARAKLKGEGFSGIVAPAT
jgi:DedD protein